MNIDAARVEGVPPSVPQPAFNSPTGRTYGMKTGEGSNGTMSAATGRWPANLIHDGSEEVVGLFPATKAGVAVNRNRGDRNLSLVNYGPKGANGPDVGYGDSGSAARFFYAVKKARG